MNRSAAPSRPPTPRRAIETPGSPSDLKGPKAASNPDGKTPTHLPGKPKSLHDQPEDGHKK